MIALSMIALGLGDEPQRMGRALSSVLPYINAAYITLTGPKDQMKPAEDVLNQLQDQYLKKIEISYGDFNFVADQKMIDWLREFFGWEPDTKVGDKIFLFDEARNFNLKQIPKEYDWFMWLDADDILRGGEKLPTVLDSATKEKVDAIYFNYLYQVEIENNKIKHVIIEHLRERVLRNDDSYKWIAPIHETLIEQRPTKKIDYKECDVLHLAEDDKRIKSLRRNLLALEYSIWKTEGKDPRPVYYLAKAYYDMRENLRDYQAVGLIHSYLYGENKSGWPEERTQANEYLCEIFRRNGMHDKAIDTALAAMKDSDSPTVFLNMATNFMVKRDWERALQWAKIAASVEGKKTTLIVNPKDIQGRLLEILYNCHLNLNHVDEAWAAAVKLADLYPNEAQIGQSLQFIEMLRQKRDVTRSIMHLADYLQRSGEPAKIKPLLAAVPQVAVDGNPFIAELYKRNMPPKYWGEKEIAIWCGPGFTNWSGKSLENPRGHFLGGSEEAIVRLGLELTKLNWEVTVFNDPGEDEGLINGVTYLPYYKFNVLDHFNILISWRQPAFFDQSLNYKKGYLDAHDVLNPLEFTSERMAKIEKVIVKSPWHRENIPEVPDNKILISSNGMD